MEEGNKKSKVVLFFGSDEYYSQFYKCSFEVDGITYCSAEQYMMHQKAITFKDEEMAAKIMAETVPKTIKSYGRKVKNFDEEVWTNTCRDVVFKGNLAKFTQNKSFQEKLLKTGDMIIAEASPFDRRWGIGLGKSNPKAQNVNEWRGKNWLGEALMKVREQLKSDLHA